MENESLLQVFEPPEGYFGQVCICCALSADQIFMEEALSRFIGRYDGTPCIYLMLDKTKAMLNASMLLGLVQLQAKSNKSIRIQHAKVALMQFGKSRCSRKLKLANDTVWRLVVSTGNWTIESACRNIEMVWKADLYAGDTKINSQLLADLFSAYDFLMKLRKNYVCNKDLWRRAEMLGDCLIQFKDERLIKKMPSSRFISTIDGNPLMGTIVEKLKQDGVKRNFIQLGSGFYEKGEDVKKPEIIRQLESNITKLKYKKIIVNKKSANQLAYWEKRYWDGWELFGVKEPLKIKDNDSDSRRDFLHAKYICLGHMVKKGLTDCKFYIGSGNLTKMGLLSAYGRTPFGGGGGNLEAGIVVDVTPECAKKMLIHGDAIKNSNFLEMSQESDDYQIPVPVCPINAFELNNNMLRPIWNSPNDIENVRIPCIILTNVGEQDLFPLKDESFLYPESRPVYIMVKWQGFDYWVPVLTADGNMPLPVTKVNSVEDLLEAIAEFPDRQDLDDVETDVEDNPPLEGHEKKFYDKIQQEVFPIQLSMKLIEGIAKCNESKNDDIIDDWIDVLERYMDAIPQTEVAKLKRMKINFLNVLTAKGFSPPLEKERSHWNAFIKRMSEKWGMAEWIGLR